MFINMKSFRNLRDFPIIHNESVNNAFFPLSTTDSLYVTVVVPNTEVSFSPIIYKLTCCLHFLTIAPYIHSVFFQHNSEVLTIQM